MIDYKEPLTFFRRGVPSLVDLLPLGEDFPRLGTTALVMERCSITGVAPTFSAEGQNKKKKTSEGIFLT